MNTHHTSAIELIHRSARLRNRLRGPAPASAAALATALTVALLTGCAPSKPEQDASTEAGDGFPVTVENCGQNVTIEKKPEKIVGFDGAAETLFALGAGDQVAGYFGAAPDDLPENLAAEAKKTENLGGTFPFPSAEAVLDLQPDLIVAYGFNDEGGSLVKRLDELKIPYLNLSEACENEPDATVDGYLTDVRTIGEAIGAKDAGEKLTDEWKSSIDAVEKPSGTPPTAVINGNQDPSKPYVSGGGSFADELLTRAGLENAYADEKKSFVTPSWEDVATRNPDIIFSGGGGGDEVRDGLLEHLKSNPALAKMNAVKTDGRVITLDYSRNVPGPQAIDGIIQMAEAAAQVSGGEHAQAGGESARGAQGE